jgi:hypothetical protein
MEGFTQKGDTKKTEHSANEQKNQFIQPKNNIREFFHLLLVFVISMFPAWLAINLKLKIVSENNIPQKDSSTFEFTEEEKEFSYRFRSWWNDKDNKSKDKEEKNEGRWKPRR